MIINSVSKSQVIKMEHVLDLSKKTFIEFQNKNTAIFNKDPKI